MIAVDFDLDFVEKYVETDNGRIHYLHHAGHDESIIFVHGFGANARTWKRLAGFLPGGLDVYLVDLIGHGKSDAPRIRYTVTLQSEAIDRLIEAEKIRGYYIFGHSYGGWVAAFHAQGSREKAGLILEDSAGLKEFIEEREKEHGYKERMFREAMLLNPRDYVVRSTIESFRNSEELTRESLSIISEPSLVLWGEDDRLIDIRYGRLLSEYIPGSDFETVNGGGHTPHYLMPEFVSGRLISFLERNRD